MAEECSSEANSTNGNNLNLDEQQMLHVLRKERLDFIKQKGKNDFSINIVQETMKAYEDEMKKIMKWQAELESENRQLEAESENDIQTKLNLENDLNMMKNMTKMFCEQLDQLKSTLQVIEVNTENDEESKTQICTEIDQYLIKQNTDHKIFEEKIAIMQALVNNEVNNNNKVIQEKKLMIEKQNEELSQLATDQQQLLTILEQGKNRNLQLENELEKRKVERENLKEEYSKLQEKFSESINIYNSDKTNYEDKNKTMERNIEIEKERIVEIQKNIELLKQNHSKLDEQISQVQIDLNDLDAKQCEKEEKFENLSSKLDEIKKDISNEDEEKETEIISLQQKLEQETEKNEKFKEENKQIKEQLEDKTKSLESIKEKLATKMQHKDETITQLEDMKQKIKENGEACENKIKELHEKINEVNIKNNQKRETNNNYKKEIEDKLKLISKIEEKIQSTTNDKLAILSKKKSTFKNFHDELKSLKKEHQALKSEMQRENKTIEKLIKVNEKTNYDKINKAEKDLKQFEEIMDTVMKDNNDKFIKEKRAEEESIKTMLLQVTDLKASKENLQEEIAGKIKDILDITNKIEAKKNEEQQKNVDNFLKEKEFKSPTLPYKSTRKTKSTVTTSTPVTNSKNPSPKIENLFTENDVNDKQINISPIEINNTDDVAMFNKNIPLTQKTESEKTEYKENIMKKHQTVNLWPTDNETTDDSYNFNKKLSATQKTDSKKSDILKPTKGLSLNSDSNKNKNISTQKSQTKKVDFKTSQNKTYKWTINSESSDDDGKNIIPPTQKPDNEKNVSQIEPEKKRAVYDFMDSGNENDIFESLKSTSYTKSTQKSNVDNFKPAELRKRTAQHFFTTDNDSSDDSFFGKMDKSKRITSNLNTKPTAVINIDTSLSDIN